MRREIGRQIRSRVRRALTPPPKWSAMTPNERVRYAYACLLRRQKETRPQAAAMTPEQLCRSAEVDPAFAALYDRVRYGEGQAARTRPTAGAARQNPRHEPQEVVPMNPTLEFKISQLPESPGVYQMKRAGEIIYVGKAINLKKPRPPVLPQLQGPHAQGPGHGRQHRRLRHPPLRHGAGGADPRVQPHQEIPPLLQHPAQGRQAVPLYPHRPSAGLPARGTRTPRGEGRREVLRPLHRGDGRARRAGGAAQLLPPAHLPARLFLWARRGRPAQALPALPDGAVPCALHGQRLPRPVPADARRDPRLPQRQARGRGPEDARADAGGLKKPGL